MNNQDLFFNYINYKHKFEIKLKEIIIAHNYSNIELKIDNSKNNMNILTITNVSWAPELSHNLLSTIFLAKKSIEIIFKKAGKLLKIIIDKYIFGLANIIKN